MVQKKKTMKRTNHYSRKHDKSAYRSGLEEVVADQLRKAGVDFKYEPYWLRYIKPEKKARYKPDFILPNGIIIETKGRFVSSDRVKMRHIKEQYPELDIRFVFSNPHQKISKKSKTTYAMWCERYGFPYATKLVPIKWYKEPDHWDSLDKLKEISF